MALHVVTDRVIADHLGRLAVVPVTPSSDALGRLA
jgi:hypothetical protein